MPAWPDWWTWDLEFTPHAENRMEERGITEVELRELLERAVGLRDDVVEGRFVATGRCRSRTWEVIVEPDGTDEVVVVVTAYPID